MKHIIGDPENYHQSINHLVGSIFCFIILLYIMKFLISYTCKILDMFVILEISVLYIQSQILSYYLSHDELSMHKFKKNNLFVKSLKLPSDMYSIPNLILLILKSLESSSFLYTTIQLNFNFNSISYVVSHKQLQKNTLMYMFLILETQFLIMITCLILLQYKIS